MPHRAIRTREIASRIHGVTARSPGQGLSRTVTLAHVEQVPLSFSFPTPLGVTRCSEDTEPATIHAMTRAPGTVGLARPFRGPASLPSENAITPVTPPSSAVRQSAQERLAGLATPPGALGHLGEAAVWASTVQGCVPPRGFDSVRLVIFAGDHGVTSHGVSAFPPEITGAMVRTFLAGRAGVSALARANDVHVRAGPRLQPRLRRPRRRRTNGPAGVQGAPRQ